MANRVSRRSWLFSLTSVAMAGSGYAGLVEPRWLDVNERSCRLPLLPAGVTIRLAHLSDLHASEFVPNAAIEHAIERTVALRPDLICVTGDFITHRTGYDPVWYERVLRRLSAAAPTFASLGNHDGGRWAKFCGNERSEETPEKVSTLVQSAGLHLLHNRATVQFFGTPLQLVGLGDLWSGEMDIPLGFQQVDPRLPTVLLSHNPDSKDVVGQYPWQLMLSGHTHGGQIVMPFTGLSPAPVKDRRYVAGLKPWRDRWLHVSTGVGNSRGVRFNCRPEVTLVKLSA